MHHGHHHGHHGGGNSFWGGYLPWNRFGDYSSSPVEVVYQQAALPDWAMYAGLGLLALIALGGRR